MATTGHGEAAQALHMGRGGPLPSSDLTPAHLAVADFARTAPSSIAVSSAGVDVDYRELHSWAGRVAHHLSLAGVGRGDRVAALMDPSAAMIAVVVGILRCGAAYVPIDRGQADQRLANILTDADVCAVVVSDDHATRVAGLGVPVIRAEETNAPLVGSAAPVRDAAELDDVAYIIYTSGSSGEPKGVVVEHRQLATSTLARRCVYPGTPVFLLLSPLAFDSSVAGIWGTLAVGGRLVVADTDEMRDPQQLLATIRQQNVTRMLCVPSLYSLLLDVAERQDAGLLASLETVISAGEVLPESLVQRHFAINQASVALVNEYGPTEATVWATYHRLERPGPVSLGRPLPGTDLYLLDADLRPVPPGVEAELFIGGAGVARGYLGRKEATEDAFIPDPFAGLNGARMYRTGDRAYWTAAGTLNFRGRLDHLVKIRGHRVELGAVEAVIRTAPGVRDAVVVPSTNALHLIGFVLAPEGGDAAELRARVRAELPEVMVPAAIHFLDTFPLTSNGKVDRVCLVSHYGSDTRPASATRQAKPGTTPHVSPATTASAVAAAWAEVLDVSSVPDDVNFFDLGGHSLGMVRLQEAVEKHTGHGLSMVDVFRYTTVAAQAALINEGGARVRRRSPARAEIGARVRLRRLPPGNSSGGTHAARCLQLVAAVADPQYRLICFPHAGGSASFFRDWGSQLDDIEVYGVCYPGRASRLAEPPPTDLLHVAEETAEALVPLADRPLVLFGHSMGAAIALEAARLLEGDRLPVAHLFASGSRDAPVLVHDQEEETREDAIARLISLGGTDAEMAMDPDFQELVLPYLLADGRMFRSYRMSSGPRLQCSVNTIVGDVDADADQRPWSELTEGQVVEHVVPGDHFYLLANPPYALLREHL